MSRGVFELHFLGRFGNQLFEYAFARGYCEMHDIELHTDPWPGEEIFEIEHPRCTQGLPRRDENSLIIGEANVSYRSYSQRQRCADYYSLRQIHRWFWLREEVIFDLREFCPDTADVVLHVRRGDYVNSIYPLVSLASYDLALEKVALRNRKLLLIREEDCATHPKYSGDLSFVPDFYCLSRSLTLFRANSSFSFWAGVLAHVFFGAKVYSPIITGLTGGIEHDCQFQPDNWSRLAELDCVEQITIKP